MYSILIADRDPASRNALQLILSQKMGISHFQEAGDVDTLIRLLADNPPDILLLDWRIYGAPAPEICRLLRKAYPNLKIALLSVDANDVISANDCGAVFIHKGAPPDEVVAVLNSLLKDQSK